MSYAAVAATNTPPHQPRPDPALLTTPQSSSIISNDENAKVQVVPNPDAKPIHNSPKKSTNLKKHLNDAEEEGFYLWELTKHYLFRPGVAGGLVGLVNVGLFVGAARSFYIHQDLRRNPAAISSTLAGAAAILAVEGYGVEQYRKTPRGHEEERRAKEEGTLIYKHLKEQVLRPGVLGGILGLVNTSILGAVGYYSYINWDKPHWDRRIVSAVSVGLLTLWGGEGYLAENYHQKRK